MRTQGALKIQHWYNEFTMNKWNIPDWLEAEVRNRNTSCIYCGVPFTQNNTSRKSMPTWEHIINDARIINPDNITLCCCCSCNASKGAKLLKVWMNSNYCISKNITAETVVEVVKRALNRLPS